MGAAEMINAFAAVVSALGVGGTVLYWLQARTKRRDDESTRELNRESAREALIDSLRDRILECSSKLAAAEAELRYERRLNENYRNENE